MLVGNILNQNKKINKQVAFKSAASVDLGNSKNGMSFKFDVVSSQDPNKHVYSEKGTLFNPGDSVQGPSDFMAKIRGRVIEAYERATNTREFQTLSPEDQKLSSLSVFAPVLVTNGNEVMYYIVFNGNKIDPKLDTANSSRFTEDLSRDLKKGKIPVSEELKLNITNDLFGVSSAAVKALYDQDALGNAIVVMVGGGIGNKYVETDSDKVIIRNIDSDDSQIKDNPYDSPEADAASVRALIGNYYRALGNNDKNFIQQQAIKGDTKEIVDKLSTGNLKEKLAASKSIETLIDGLGVSLAGKLNPSVDTIVLAGPLLNGIRDRLAEISGNPDELSNSLKSAIVAHSKDAQFDVEKLKIGFVRASDNTVGAPVLNNAIFNSNGKEVTIPLEELRNLPKFNNLKVEWSENS